MKSISLRVFVGAVAGLFAWMIMEPSAPANMMSKDWDSWELLFMLVLGALVGGGIGGINGYLTGGKIHTAKGLVLGIVFGVVGIMLGWKIGGGLVLALFGSSAFTSGNIVTMILARVVALTPVGAMLGAGIGASTLSFKRVYHGFLGGAIGGGIGGAAFDIIGSIVGSAVIALKHIPPGQQGEVGGTSRAVYAIVLGAGIALFIGIVENMARSAWIRQVLGRGEGREWPLYNTHTVIGRSESATIPIFGDPAIQPYHATISNAGGQYVITDGGAGMLVDNQPVAQANLYSGATIQLGSTRLLFLMKEGQAPYRAPEPYGVPAYPAGPAPGYPQQPVGMPMQPVPSAPTNMTPMAPVSQPTVMTPVSGFMLVAIDGPLTGQRYPVSQPTEVGRDCPGIPISFDSSASRRHASLAPGPGGLTVADLGSTNGVFVDGQRVQSAIVASGHTLKIGATTFRVE